MQTRIKKKQKTKNYQFPILKQLIPKEQVLAPKKYMEMSQTYLNTYDHDKAF